MNVNINWIDQQESDLKYKIRNAEKRIQPKPFLTASFLQQQRLVSRRNQYVRQMSKIY